MKLIQPIKAGLFAAMLFLSSVVLGQSELMITGVYDGPLTGGTPKGVELYVLNDIPDLSIYGLGSANNGGGTDGEEFTFPADAATAGDYIYVASEDVEFPNFFGFAPDYVSGAMSINGDDAIELFQNGSVVDLYGDINLDGTGQAWEYLDSWAYRNNGTSPSATFSVADWSIPGPNVFDGETTNADAGQPMPIGTFDPEGGTTITVYTIFEIQETTDPSGDSPVVGELVETSGIVTAVGNDGFWIEDPMGGSWSGIFVLDPGTIASRGDNVTVEGTVQENFDLTRISASSVAVNSSGNPLPSPVSVSTAAANSEEYESVLLSVSGAICLDPDAGFGEYVLNDGSGDYLADDLLFAFTPTLFAEYDAVGIGYFSFGDYKLLPRDADDIEDTGNNQLVVGFENTNAAVLENAGSTTFDVVIVNPVISATTVDVVVTGGTAVNGVDYNFTDPTGLSFPGSSSANQSFSVTIVDNATDDENKTIVFGLANANNGALLLPNALEVTILDDEVTTTDIAVVSEVDVDGVAVNNGQEFTIQGTALGVNLGGSNTQFTIFDETGGMGIFDGGSSAGYTVTEGDELLVTGTVSQFNGLTQLNPSSIVVLSQGNPIPAPTTITALGEDTESELVVFECATLVDPAQWTNSGSGFNVDVTDGTNTIVVRIDNDVDLYNQPAPTGEFDVVGIGGQFDNSNPFTSGYQLLPRSSADILPSSCAAGPAQVSILTLPCGGEILQVTGAFAGSTAGGTATDETRTIYAYQPDNAGGVPNYVGANWPYVLAPNGVSVDAGISATVTVGANDVLLINGWPAYQFVNDLDADDANGNFGPWFYYENDGALTQDPCAFVCENPFPQVDPASLSDTFTGTSILLEWDFVPNQIGCQVVVRFAGGATLGQKIVGGATVSQLNVPGGVLSPGTDYEWRVRCGCSQAPLVAGPWTPWTPFSTPGGAGISTSPNPTTGVSFVSFTVESPSYTTLEVFDMSGKLVDAIFTGTAQPGSEYRFEFDGSALPNGVYLYRLTTENEVVNEKFMIAR